MNVNAMALWAARIRHRWLLAPCAAFRAFAGVALAGLLAFRTVRVFRRE